MLASGIHDPLTLNLRRQTNALLSTIPISSQYAIDIQNASSTTQLLTILSKLLAAPALTLTVADLYRPILYDLCARWLEDQQSTEEQLVALCLLIEVHEELFPILHRLLLKPAFKEGPLAFITTEPSPLSIDASRLHRLLLAHYRILQANRELPRHLIWPLTPLSLLIWTPHLDNGARLLAIRCYALQSGMGEAEREKMEHNVLGEICGVDCQLDYGQNIDASRKEVDGWIMPVIELRRVRDMRQDMVMTKHDYFVIEEGNLSPPINVSDLSPLVANVHGILLLRSHARQPDITTPLITTPTTINALQSIAVHLSLRLPTLLTSASSSGKSLFLSHLANQLFPGTTNHIITIHLADTSLDPRALLGSYASSPTRPGTFEWKEGVLTRSMREGKWIVFKDIDRGSNEVLGVIKPLVESLRLGKWIGGRASLDIPGRGRVVAHDNFALFATRSINPSRTGTFPPPVFFGAHKFHEVLIPAPSPGELNTILNAQFRKLAGSAVLAIIRLWESVKGLGSAASARDIGLRELEKFCTRIERLLPMSYHPMDVDPSDSGEPLSLSAIFPNPTLREDIYLEARDVFFSAGTPTAAARAHADAIAFTIGEHLGLDADRREWVLHGLIPEFNLKKDVNANVLAAHIGRTRLPARSTKLEIAPPPMRPFAMHKPAVLLLSRIATALSFGEPVLLTGETGTGKTSAITHLAGLLRWPLVSLNLSHQTESSDLLGGFKPIDVRIPGAMLQQRFLELFGGTFSRRKNEKFEGEVRKAVAEGRWKRAVGLWRESGRMAVEKIQGKGNGKEQEKTGGESREMVVENPRKRRKVEESVLRVSEEDWALFVHDVDEFDVQHVQGKGKFAFGFVEGPLVKALRSGDWVLLDEINLASSETLECISGLLHGPTASITLTEQGSLEPVPRHPDFRLFACMNPATDVGKKDLPPNIRSRFTEIDVPPPDADKDTLLSIVAQYIGASAVGDKGAIMNVAEFYAAVKDLAEKRQIADGSNHRPHFSMRTLARALMFASDTVGVFGLRRAIWEGCLMAFTMVLDATSMELVTALAQKHLLVGVRNPRSMLMKEPSVAQGRSPDEFIKFGPFYLERGVLPEDPVEDYIMTPSVETKLIDLARIILTRRFPILIEGPTSSGKTSSVEYLAKRTGHQFIRINNHEHTDIQEYIGSYVSDPLTGKLVFKDGLLVRALRNGDWIVLDELNLAPTDVLEALNRLLDDNRELIIPETQEIVRPHPHFMLFATQNPPGLYAGRKVLSRAFRNRFLEVHFEDVPQAELETILCQRCQIAPSYGKKIVSVFHELQKRRQSSRVFESKQGFATLRDLFRWAGRDAIGYQELADNGYMLLAERTRRADDKAAVKEVIESVMNVTIDEQAIYNLQNPGIDFPSFLGCPLPNSSDVVWTGAMQRLFTLVARALRFNEPVLLVGETGSGKTSVCQVFAEASSQRLHGLNCHQNTETADLIGGLRPVRNRSTREAEVFREVAGVLQETGVVPEVSLTFDALALALSDAVKPGNTLSVQVRSRLVDAQTKLLRLQSIFQWHDGPLVEAMRNGDVFLLDEISLADDSVLERLNSVLEPARTTVLAERGGDDLEYPAIQAVDHFKLVATMNPGGDYGKKELSPALRNRFTEIWVPPVDNRLDLKLIVSNSWKCEALKPYTSCILDFTEWLCTRVGDRSISGLRDILAWVMFVNSAYEPDNVECIPPRELFHHAAHMTFLDGLGSLPQLSGYSQDVLHQLKDDALSKLFDLVPLDDHDALFTFVPAYNPVTSIQFGSFAIPKGPQGTAIHTFNLQAPTTRDNAMRVVRACQVRKPILLEGSPGVGKTSLITALANISGHELFRINLSDQTDLIDLFGSDLPVEGGGPGEFAWKDAEFLKALQEGHWVLLDEMNLAPQAVLEGLNAVLDHRGTVYIPELGRSFTRHPSFRIFAAQNPLNQGGGRKGLPKSFVNRFTKVYIEQLSPSDLLMVCQHMFPDLDEDIVRAMVSFNMHLDHQVGIQHSFAREGTPWEFNLRDVIRWGTLLRTHNRPLHPVQHLRTVYLHRFRTENDRNQARLLFDKVFSMSMPSTNPNPYISVSHSHVQIGDFTTSRKNMVPFPRPGRILKMHLSALESIGHCVLHSWLSILTGQQNSGKTEAIRVLAHFTGNKLQEISVNSATDTMDILGSFEQADIYRQALNIVDEILSLLEDQLRSWSGSKRYQEQTHSLRRARNDSVPLQSLLRTASDIVAGVERSSEVAAALLNKITSLLEAPEAVGRFEWVDGPLVRAMKSGYWLLLDGANLCNPSVLDRLNPLCEPDGFLTLSERGYDDGKPQILKPHPNFRLFMTVDPQYGELSRAMRNRGIEIAFVAKPRADDPCILSDFRRLPPLIKYAESPYLAFDAVRRGLLFQADEGLNLKSSTGRSLDQDSGLSTLVDQAPMVVLSSSKATGVTDAHLFFFARTVAPAYLPHFNRFLASVLLTSDSSLHRLQALLNTFPGPSLITALKRFRNARSASLGLSFELVCTQPMDVYLASLPTIRESPSKDISSPHCMLLQELDLAVMLFLDEEEKARIDPSDVEKHNEKDNIGLALRQIASVLAAINSLGYKMLDSPDLDECDTKMEEIRLTLTLLEHGRHLRRTMTGDTFDFSSVQAITRWITDSVENCSSAFMSLATQARALSETVSLSSGLGLTEIWSAFFVDELPGSVIAKVRDLENSLQQSMDPSLRRQIFDFMALRTLPASNSEVTDSQLSELGSKLEHHLLKHRASPSQDDLVVEPTVLAAELTIYERLTIPEALIKFLEKIIDLACTIGGPVLRLVSYQHLIWTIQVGKNPIPIMAQIQTQWLRALWTRSSDHLYNGPSMLLHPIELDATFIACDWKRNSLRTLQVYEQGIYRRSRLVLLQCEHELQRVDQLSAFLRQSISLIAACFAPSLEIPVQSNLRHLKFCATKASVAELMALLQQTTNTSFKLTTEKHLRPLCSRLRDGNSRQECIADLGLCWIAIANIIIDLFVPDTPIDPVAIQNCTIARWRFDHEMLSAQLGVHRQLEEVMTGNSDTDFLDYLESKLNDVAKKLSVAPRLPTRKDVSRLHMFWSEVSQFQNHILLPSKIEGLVVVLQRGEESAIQREQVLQQSMAGFCQRLDTVYVEYADLTAPLHLAILHMRVGLRLVAHSNHPGQDAFSRTASALVAFPSVRSSDMLYADSSTAGSPSITAFGRLVLTLAAIVSESSSGVAIESQIKVLDENYGQALRLWLIDQAKEKEMNEASQSLYRRKNLDHDAPSEAEIEEQEFHALFPSFEDLPPTSWTPTQRESHHSALVHPTEMHQLVSIHNRLFAPSKVEDAISTNITDFRTIRRSALGSLLSSNLHSLPDTLDTESLSLQMSLLHYSQSELRSAAKINKKSYDFYVDANVPEAKKAALMVTGLNDRLEVLIEEWPEQMVLHHLRSRCDAVLGLPLHSPVAKILSALEQLLLQTEDWEAYANRDNTLKPYQQDLIRLIVEWRRMELSCWQVLLESQARTFVDGASEWWFRLYDAVVRGPLDAWDRETSGTPQSLTQYLDSLIPLLDDFMRSSSLGQFHVRIRLLQSFEKYLQSLAHAKSGNERVALHRVRCVLHATEQYYGLFSTQLATHLSVQRETLETEIRGFIKLASWKDVNVQALKQSAQRTHHQLYKIIRKFRDLLRQPISERLRPQLASVQEIKETPLDVGFPKSVKLRPLSPDSHHGAKLLFYQLDINQTLAKFASFLETRVRPFIHSRSALVLDDLAVEIVVTAKELAAITIPSELPTERQDKQQKALLVRKKKAWSDLLKELKRAGLSPNIKPEVLRQQTDLRWLREQPVMLKISDLAPLIDRSESYFMRLCGCLPEIRSSVSNHNSDLTTRELQRGILLLESGFSMAVDLRSRLADALLKICKLDQITTRLHMLSSSPKLSLCGSLVLEQVMYTRHLLCRLSDALRETQDGMRVFNELQPKAIIQHSVMEEIAALCASTSALQSGFSVVVRNVKLGSLPFLLEHECELFSEVRQHFIETSATLRRWSQTHPRLGYLFHAVERWLATQQLPSLPPPEINEMPSPSIDEDLLINSLLVTVQTLISKCPEPQPTDAKGEHNDQYILQGYRVVRDFTHLLNIDTILSALDYVTLRFPSHGTQLDQHLRRILPFLDHYLDLVKDQLTLHSQWTKALFKLDFVICSVLHTLSEQGFCKPADFDDSKDGEDTAEGAGGVGLGEGSGSQNVSKDIEDESQVEGLQGDEQQDTTDNKGDKNAIEMSDDFGGDMEDVPDTESQDGEGSDQESDIDPEERLSNLDASDPSAVDEKLWGDEPGPQDDHPQDKPIQDRSEQQSGESEVSAKEGREPQKAKEQPSDQKEASDESNSDVEDERIPEDVEDDSLNDPDISGAPIDDYVQNANTLDLPDDMDLDKDNKDLGGDLPEDLEIDEEPADDAMDDDSGLESKADDTTPEQQTEAPLPDNPPEYEQDTEMPGQPQETGSNPETEATEENTIARPNVSAGDGVASMSDPSISEGKESTSGGEGAAGEDVPSDNKQTNESATQIANEVERQNIAESPDAGSAPAGSQDGQAHSQSDSRPSTNPLRSLGDTLKEIQQRFDDILGGEQRDILRERTGDTSIPSQVEYLHPEDADHDMQALGPAGEEQVAKLNDLKIVDESDQVGETVPMDVDPPLEPETHELPSHDVASQLEPKSVEQRESVEGAILPDTQSRSTDHPADLPTIKTDVDREDTDQTVETQLREWQTLGFPAAGGENIWRLYESLTHDLAYALCEQLRLILEPTLATRLKGDYRTGKRLNMKKIISYIASDYTKDKIWLRRTKPSQREYQVLIAIDDSRSMAESHSIHLAYETLALVSKALSRLESGEIAVAKFGESIDILHGLDDGPFTDQSGTKVISSFRFNQKATNVLSLVDTSLKVLENARERRSMSSATAADLWQLEIIISDGMCQDHDRLRTVLRKAEEQRVMIVFIIIDSLHSAVGSSKSQIGLAQGSILTMDKAEFKNVGGRMELQLQKYLDSFPFEYYVVLRNVEALPEVLAGTLKQFFERISEQ